MPDNLSKSGWETVRALADGEARRMRDDALRSRLIEGIYGEVSTYTVDELQVALNSLKKTNSTAEETE
ncbi:MAG: hypothetical protein JWO07_719 [Candidatus Saccharibacteria bacterium]|nr:hypothetical protein [Candidatus Saccharibacteria bacterium]